MQMQMRCKSQGKLFWFWAVPVGNSFVFLQISHLHSILVHWLNLTAC